MTSTTFSNLIDADGQAIGIRCSGGVIAVR